VSSPVPSWRPDRVHFPRARATRHAWTSASLASHRVAQLRVVDLEPHIVEVRHLDLHATRREHRAQIGDLGTHRLELGDHRDPLRARIEEFRGTWRATGTLPPHRLNSLRQIATIESIGSSTRIEGSALTDHEVESLLRGVGVRRFATRDEQEVAGYAEAIDLIINSHGSIPLSENHIRQLHRDLLRHSEKDERHRGHYKSASNNVVAFDEHGKQVGVVFETATPFETPRLMSEQQPGVS